jgi:hypothetical protein
MNFRKIALMVIILAGAILAISNLWKWNLALFGILLLLLFLYILIFRESLTKEALLTFALAAFIGTITEIICIAFGGWKYTTPNLLGVPIWLPIAWGCVVVFINELVTAITK